MSSQSIRKKLFLILFIFITLTNYVHGQDNVLQGKLIDETYTWRTASSDQVDSFYFNLQPVQSTIYKSHIRISLTGQIIDLFSSDKENFQGVLTNLISEYKTVNDKESDYDQSKVYQYVFEQIYLEQVLVDKMVATLRITKQVEIPTDSLTPSWQRNFLHCNGLVFQFNLDGKYVKQIFHYPGGQNDSVPFKYVVLENYDSLKSIFRLDSLYNLFKGRLPRGKTYSSDGYGMMYKLTDKQLESWKKDQPRRDYLKSIKDTVDSYINAELLKQNKLKNLDCIEDYRLTFGKNGKLKKVEVSKSYKPKLKDSIGLSDYLSDKKKIRNCESRVRQLFGEVDLSFLNLKYEVNRKFSFGTGEGFLVIDETFY